MTRTQDSRSADARAIGSWIGKTTPKVALLVLEKLQHLQLVTTASGNPRIPKSIGKDNNALACRVHQTGRHVTHTPLLTPPGIRHQQCMHSAGPSACVVTQTRAGQLPHNRNPTANQPPLSTCTTLEPAHVYVDGTSVTQLPPNCQPTTTQCTHNTSPSTCHAYTQVHSIAGSA
jgi:hypothetical protein